MNPPGTNLDHAFALAQGCFQIGDFSGAKKNCFHVLASEPQHAGALHMMGFLTLKNGNPKQALPFLKKAVESAPQSEHLLVNLGEAYLAIRKFNEASQSFQSAIQINPKNPHAHSCLGMALRNNGSQDLALDAFQSAATLDSGNAFTWCNLGASLQEAGQPDEAVQAFRKADALSPRDPDIQTNLGTALAAIGATEEAHRAFQNAIFLNPRNSAAYNNLGNLFLKTGSPEAAIEAFQKALELEPDRAELHNNLGNAFKQSGRIEEAIESYTRTIRKFKNYPEAHSNLLFCMHYSARHDALTIRDAHVRWNQNQAKRLMPSQLKHPNHRDPHKPLRIGYVSADFRNHPVARFLLPLLQNHDKKLFEIHAFMCSRERDHETSRLQSSADHWHDISSASDEEASSLIRRNQIDVLVDLALHSAGNRMLVFARKPAPVQVTWLAYAGTSGLNTMNHRISDPYLDPPSSDCAEYTESTIRLPHTFWCYQPALEIAPGAPPANSNGYVTFGCFNNFCKVNQEVLKLWAELLASVPFSRLHLHAPTDEVIRSRILEFLRVDPSRVRFFANTSPGNYFEQFHGIDIALDPFPFGGGTSSCDALWMGVPVVTLKGPTAVGRGGTSILSNIGLQELAADSEEDYLRIATALAGESPRLAELREKLRSRMRCSPLMDAPEFARAMEAAYRQMWHSWSSTGK